jgi:hypothetical protein
VQFVDANAAVKELKENDNKNVKIDLQNNVYKAKDAEMKETKKKTMTKMPIQSESMTMMAKNMMKDYMATMWLKPPNRLIWSALQKLQSFKTSSKIIFSPKEIKKHLIVK